MNIYKGLNIIEGIYILIGSLIMFIIGVGGIYIIYLLSSQCSR